MAVGLPDILSYPGHYPNVPASHVPGFFAITPASKGGSGILAYCYFVTLRPLSPFQQAWYDQVFPLKPALFCKLFSGLASINKSATSLLLSDFGSVLTTLSSSPSFLLSQSMEDLAGTVFSLLLFYQATDGPRTHVSPGKRRG